MAKNTNNWDKLRNVHVHDISIMPKLPESFLSACVPISRNLFFYVTEGTLSLEIDKKHHNVLPGQLLLVPNGSCIFIPPIKDPSLSFYAVFFLAETDGEDILTRLGCAQGNLLVTISDPDSFLTLCRDAYVGTGHSVYANAAMQHANVVHMLSYYVNARMHADAIAAPFAPVLTHMEQHLTAPPKLSELADIVHMSTEYFIRRFRQVFACPPIKYHDNLRVNQAIHLLTETDMPIRQIGIEIGIYEAAHFTRFFRNITQLTPSEYRDLHEKTLKVPHTFKKTLPLTEFNLIPGNVRYHNAHAFWLEDEIYDDDTIIYASSGSFAFLSESGRLSIVREHQAVLLPAHHRCRYTLTAKQNLTLFRADFLPSANGKNFFELLGITDDPLAVDIEDWAFYEQCCDLALYSRPMQFDLAYHLLRIACMIKLVALYTDGYRANLLAEPDEISKRAVDYMKEHLDGSATVLQLSSIFKTEPSYFIRKFKKSYGCTPKHYYDKLRLLYVQEALLKSKLPIADVAHEFAFPSSKAFHTFFRENTGVSPQEYRNLYHLLIRSEKTTDKES